MFLFVCDSSNIMPGNSFCCVFVCFFARLALLLRMRRYMIGRYDTCDIVRNHHAAAKKVGYILYFEVLFTWPLKCNSHTAVPWWRTLPEAMLALAHPLIRVEMAPAYCMHSQLVSLIYPPVHPPLAFIILVCNKQPSLRIH